jgi:arginase
MRVALIYATWPTTPFGATWYKFTDSLSAAGLGQALKDAGHEVKEHVLTVEGLGAKEMRGAFELAGDIAARCREAVKDGVFPVIICGSCTVASLGGVAGLAPHRTGILWMDAHPDVNTPDSTSSGMLEGMALSIALGKCWKHMAEKFANLRPASPRDVCLYGARDIEPPEAIFLAENDIPTLSAAGDIVARLADCSQVYIHLDMDVHDALQVRTNSFAVPGGPTIEALRTTLAEVTEQLPVGALAVTGLDPEASDAALAIETAIAHIRAVCDSRSAALTC